MFLKWKSILSVLSLLMVSCVYCDQKTICKKGTESCDEEEVEIYPELNGLNQNDPKLIQALKTKILVKPKKGKIGYRRLPSAQSLRGQYGQPYKVEDIMKKHKIWKKIKKRKQPGFFIEAGASGGEMLSNSLYFEVKHNWTGLLVEPSPDFLEQLMNEKNRNAWILPHCLSTTNWVETVEFDAAMFHGGIILPGKTLPSNLGNRPPKGERWGRSIKVQCFPLQSVLSALNNPIVDYFSLDVEGSEFPILKSLDWDKVKINVLSVEMAHTGEIFEGTQQEIRDFLDSKGYEFVDTVEIDDIFVNKALIKK